MKNQKAMISDQNVMIAATASGVLALVAVLAAIWRLILSLRAAGLI
jgi:hypothetical protein